MFLEKLKLLAAEILVQTLNTSNCIPTYCFVERNQCEDLLSNTRKFFLAHFTAIYAANREDVLKMSSKEVEMWISSDKIDVSAEEDVYKLILAWIDRPRRITYLYPFMTDHVRFEYVSPDFLSNDILTSKRGQILLPAKDALRVVVNKNRCHPLRQPPRKSLETSALVINVGSYVLCYFPHENSWYQLSSRMRSQGKPIHENQFMKNQFVTVSDGHLVTVSCVALQCHNIIQISFIVRQHVIRTVKSGVKVSHPFKNMDDIYGKYLVEMKMKCTL